MGTPSGRSGKLRKVFGILVAVYTACLLAATIATAISLYFVNDLLANATRVDGEIIGLEQGSKGALTPVVRFKTAGGEVLELKSYLSTSPAPKVGETVKVVYRTSNPKDWRIDDWINVYFWTVLSSAFMIAWAIAITVTRVVGDYQIRKADRVG